MHREIAYSICEGDTRVDGAWVDDVDAAVAAWEARPGSCRVVGNFMLHPDDPDNQPLRGFTVCEK